MVKTTKSIFLIASVFLLSAACLHAYADPVSPEDAEKLRTALVEDGKKYIGAPYQYGAIGPDSFDCSGFIYSVARESTGYQLPRTSKALYSFVKVIPQSKLEKGDIVFFRTTESRSISHAGIYIGNNQFMHAVSDGPNTGVIVSSLKEAYWKSVYAGCGQFLPSAGETDPADTVAGTAAESEHVSDSGSAAEKKEGINRMSTSHSSGSISPFLQSLVFDASIGVDWSFFTANRFLLNFRGVPITTNLRCSSWPLEPGIGTIVRFNTGVGAIQVPIIFSITVNDYVRAYAGPVITIGQPELPGKSEDIDASVFPGIIGLSWQTPSFTKGTVKVTLTQDIVYTVFNDTDGGALSAGNSLAAGLVFSTGVRVTFPFSVFLH
jgi:hypothetical protein